MPARVSTVVSPRCRLGVLIAVAALLIVPPIVRATATMKSPSPLRLNRGFETPPSKADAVIGLELTTAATAAHNRLEPPRPARTLRPLASFVPLGRHDDSPDPLRGPPASSIR